MADIIVYSFKPFTWNKSNIFKVLLDIENDIYENFKIVTYPSLIFINEKSQVEKILVGWKKSHMKEINNFIK
ncbi:hypothetical protein BBF96_00730 [Anoxybacter fermentans]|uniref:Thioredoxin-like fold domain-containing protein n=1 Tax=Anoxybacter fermentans TaxID=1323375 RepID=A0A3Q9HNH0_9FIRM|nr:hypothetical protein BBF96_00730 [Anoxybacter fermentans]